MKIQSVYLYTLLLFVFLGLFPSSYVVCYICCAFSVVIFLFSFGRIEYSFLILSFLFLFFLLQIQEWNNTIFVLLVKAYEHEWKTWTLNLLHSKVCSISQPICLLNISNNGYQFQSCSTFFPYIFLSYIFIVIFFYFSPHYYLIFIHLVFII